MEYNLWGSEKAIILNKYELFDPGKALSRTPDSDPWENSKVFTRVGLEVCWKKTSSRSMWEYWQCVQNVPITVSSSPQCLWSEDCPPTQTAPIEISKACLLDPAECSKACFPVFKDNFGFSVFVFFSFCSSLPVLHRKKNLLPDKLFLGTLCSLEVNIPTAQIPVVLPTG